MFTIVQSTGALLDLCVRRLIKIGAASNTCNRIRLLLPLPSTVLSKMPCSLADDRDDVDDVKDEDMRRYDELDRDREDTARGFCVCVGLF